MRDRKAGVVLHISSLPGRDAIGTLGDAAPFVEYFKAARVLTWQILPIGPTIIGDSPFQGPSAFAGSPNLISLDLLATQGDLEQKTLKRYYQQLAGYAKRRGADGTRTHYEFLWTHKIGFCPNTWGYRHGPLRAAFKGFTANADRRRMAAYRRFIDKEAHWLHDFAMFMALKAAYGFPKEWSAWHKEDRLRLDGWGKRAEPLDIEFHKYVQFVFDEQMRAFLARTKSAGLELLGDIPMFTAYDSADVWSHSNLFQLGPDRRPTHVACVPPDYYNPKGGQLWGNPLYAWGAVGDPKTHREVFEWWTRRLSRLFQYHTVIRIDHFRGFTAYGRVPADAKDANCSRWTPGPGTVALKYVQKKLGRLQIVAEDLGVITPKVRADLNSLGYPGMRVLQFSDFTDRRSWHLPCNASANSVVYTGTHDSPTLVEWYTDYSDKEQRERIDAYLDARYDELGTVWKAIDVVLQSAAERAIIPMQDLLELGGKARMNFPSRLGYWQWRMNEKNVAQFRRQAAPRLRRLILSTKRA